MYVCIYAHMVIFIHLHIFIYAEKHVMYVQEDYLWAVSNHGFSLIWYHCISTPPCQGVFVFYMKSNSAKMHLYLQHYAVTLTHSLQSHDLVTTRLPFPSLYFSQWWPTLFLLYKHFSFFALQVLKSEITQSPLYFTFLYIEKQHSTPSHNHNEGGILSNIHFYYYYYYYYLGGDTIRTSFDFIWMDTWIDKVIFTRVQRMQSMIWSWYYYTQRRHMEFGSMLYAKLVILICWADRLLKDKDKFGVRIF
jgi:hypothetical protein